MAENDLEAPLPDNIYTIRQILSGHVGTITALVWSPDGQYLAASDLAGFIYLCNGETGVLLHTRLGSDVPVNIIWSPDSQRFVTSNFNGTIDLWDIQSSTRPQVLREHTSFAWSVVWSSDGRYLALGSLNGAVSIWDTQNRNILHTLSGHTEPVITVAWSSDGYYLASGSLDQKVCVWDPMTGDLIASILSTQPIKKIVWFPNTHELIYTSLYNTLTRWKVEFEQETFLPLLIFADDSSTGASGWSQDGRNVAIDYISGHTIILLDIEKNYTTTLEGLIGQAKLLTFSADSQRLAAFTSSDLPSLQNSIDIWRKNVDIWVRESSIKNIPAEAIIAFHPDMEAFVVVDKANSTLTIFRRDETTYSMDAILADTVSYKNAKVVLVGDTGVGKTGLAHVLAGEPFRETSSSHGRHIWAFDEDKVYREAQCVEIREVFLWDLVGQPGYRLIHQLHLDAVTIALMVFDARSETKPFTGVEYWERALRQARSVLMTSTPMPEIKKFLVSARVDRVGTAVSNERINNFMQECGFDRNQLMERGILPWVDDWELQPGYVRQEGIESSLKLARSAAVFFGKGGAKSWVRLLEQAFVREFVDHNRPLIPVILPEATELIIPDLLPSTFQGMNWIDFRQKEPDPFELLEWGITGKRPDLR